MDHTTRRMGGWRWRWWLAAEWGWMPVGDLSWLAHRRWFGPLCSASLYPAECRNRAAYMVRAVSRESRPPKKSYLKRRQPPTLPETVRLISVPKGKVGRATPKVEEDRESPRQKSNAVSTVVPDDPFETSEGSHDISTLSPMGAEVKLEDLEASLHATCFVGTLDNPKGRASTMCKTQKKVVKRGVFGLSYHDALLSHCLRLSSFDSSPDPNIAAFTFFSRYSWTRTWRLTWCGPVCWACEPSPRHCWPVRLCSDLFCFGTVCVNTHPAWWFASWKCIQTTQAWRFFMSTPHLLDDGINTWMVTWLLWFTT